MVRRAVDQARDQPDGCDLQPARGGGRAGVHLRVRRDDDPRPREDPRLPVEGERPARASEE
eukprot:4082130-Pyramimonas_sp.AAC.1